MAKFTNKEQARLKNLYGPWAIVTGASAGIGMELAERLAEAGLNLVINGRHAERLQAVEKRLTTTYGVMIRVVVADMSEEAGIAKIIESSLDIEVGLLVASAGFGTSGLFVDASLHAEINMLRVNCEAVLSLTHYYSQRFVQQKRGGIILLSSIVAFQGVPYAANYAATKAYIQSLGEALAFELKPSGVDILTVAPGPVDSGFGQRANMKLDMSLKPSQVGIPILRALGRKRFVLPGLLSIVLMNALRTAPRGLRTRIMAGIMGGFTKHQRG